MSELLAEPLQTNYESGLTDLLALDAPQLPTYETTVEDRNPVRVEYQRAGTVYVDLVEMDDGTAYEIKIGQPSEQRTDVPVVFTTAWFTGTEGHNKRVLLKIMEAGYPVMMVGPEGVVRNPGDYASMRARSQAKKLGYTAHSVHEMLTHVSQSHQFDETRMIGIGESRGAMTTLCMEPTAADHQRDIVHAVAVAPCYAKKFNKGDIPRFVGQVAYEPFALARSLGKLSMGARAHYLKTYPVGAGIPFLIQSARLAPILFSGETGRYAELIPKDRSIDIRVFSHDVSGQASEWRKIFASHSNINIETLPGGHLSIPDALPETLASLNRLLPTL